MRSQSPARIAALLLVLAASTLSWSQQTASIIGVTRVVRGNFPEPIMVILQLHGATVYSTYTDNEGRFSFNSVPGNLYRVIINDEHYSPVDIEVPIRPDVMSMNFLQITLVPRQSNSSKDQSGPYVVSSADLARDYPKNAVKEFERGVKLETEGKADEAIEHYRKALEKAPNFALAHNNLGSLYVGKSDFANGQKELAESIRLAPKDSKSYFNMANLMLLTGKLQEAQRYLQDGFRTQPESAFGLFVQGSVLERTGKMQEAEAALRRSLELDPKLTHAHLELVNLYLREQRPAEAVPELRRFLQEAPTDPLAPKVRQVLQKLEAGTSRSPGR